MGAVDRGIRASRSEFSAAGIVIGLCWWRCQTAATAAAAAASVAKPVSVAQWRQRHDHEGVPGLDRREVRGWQRHTYFQNPGLFFLPGRTTTRTPQGKSPTSWKCLIATESTWCGLVDVLCRPKARFSSCGRPSIMNCAVDIRKSLCTKVVLNDSVGMFQGIGEQTPNERNVSSDEVFCVSNSECRSQLGHKACPS